MRYTVTAILATLIAAGPAQGSTSVAAVSDEATACARVKSRVAAELHFPASGPPGGWFCDFASGWDRTLYVIALRSNRQCPEICSNLMGWYAIQKLTGEVGRFDLDEGRMVPLADTGNGPH